jgi:hypothetical protein
MYRLCERTIPININDSRRYIQMGNDGHLILSTRLDGKYPIGAFYETFDKKSTKERPPPPAGMLQKYQPENILTN